MTTATAEPESGLFDRGPPRRLEDRLHFAKPGRSAVTRRAIAVVLAGWVPLLLLVSIQSANGAPGLGAFFSEVAVHARSLFAVPFFAIALAISTPGLTAIALHFVDAGIIGERDRGCFDGILESTRRLLDSRIAEGVIVVLAYVVAIASIPWTPGGRLPPWAWSAVLHPTPAGAWQTLVSLPLLLVFLLGWLWRIALWTRFLWLVGRLDLRLIAGHPDRAAGLGFVGQSLHAFVPVALALATIVAGGAGNHMLRDGLSLHSGWFIVGAEAAAIILFCGPMLTLVPALLAEQRRGVLQYGTLAHRVGLRFEGKWLDRPGFDRGVLESPDFSSTTDLYQVVANAYEMRVAPPARRDVAVLAIATALPFVPVAFLAMPLETILSWPSQFLL